MSTMTSSLSPSLSKYPQPIYKEHDLHTIPKHNKYNVNYWKLAMSDYIEGNGLIAFIDGSITPPPEKINEKNEQLQGIENPDYTQWKQIDDQAAVEGNLKSLQEILLKEPNVVSAVITGAFETALIVACHRNMNSKFVEKLISLMSPQDLAMQNSFGKTAMFGAAVVGNVEAMKMMVDKNPNLPNITDIYNQLPIQSAAYAGQKHAVHYLLEVTGKKYLEPRRSKFVHTLLIGGFYVLPISASGNERSTHKSAQQLRRSAAAARSSSAGLPDARLLGASMLRAHCSVQTLIFDFLKLRLRGNLPSVELESPIHYYKNTCDIENPTEEAEKGTKRRGYCILRRKIRQGRHLWVWLERVWEGGHQRVLPNGWAILWWANGLKRYACLAFSSFPALRFLAFAMLWQRRTHLSGRSDLPSVELESPIHYYKNTCDIENPTEEAEKVPEIKQIQKKKVMHTQALKLLRFICGEISKLDSKRIRDLIGQPLQAAAAMGNVEVVEEILISIPNAIHLVNENKHGVFQIAILNRKASVFNLIYQITTQRHLLLDQIDTSYNNALHLAANMVGGTKDETTYDLRSSAPGAALQMQRELQWFKVVKELSWPQDQEERNMFGKTPATIFTQTHENLAKEGEQWMKDRANSGIIVATLIATIMFTSAITVPGGSSSSNGLPIFTERQAFVVFAVSDALALFMSASSMLMFLGILTARYAVQDFLYSLPKRLIIALISLFLSIIFMMISFTSILYLVFGDEKRWVLGLVSSMATIPVLLFASLQFNPLLDIISSTYGPGIFGKRGDSVIL
ncbi:hypothetical protein E3N88_13369 [Mikania micrantha]|uniref:PGG domain-containing protein n=1 Tax=Mikania micrantha TaxID=192012 RepID=A0A5N6P8A3_9ASTR|nr:hypothetical protein E3N88_13369 [Mikania micrantha]